MTRGLRYPSPPLRSRSASAGRRRLTGAAGVPSPFADLRHVLAVLTDVTLVDHQPVAEELLHVGGTGSKAGHAIDDIAREVKAIQIVQDHHVEWSRRGPFLFIAANVEVRVIRPTIRQPVNQPRVAVEGEDNW